MFLNIAGSTVVGRGFVKQVFEAVEVYSSVEIRYVCNNNLLDFEIALNKSDLCSQPLLIRAVNAK